jgi:hypothetical protein
MRSKWIIALAAASALVPAAAIAQDGRRGGEGRAVRAERSGGNFDRSEFLRQRQEMRGDRQAARAARPDRPVNRDFARPQRPAMAENQPQGPRREFRQERREDRADFRRERRDDRGDFRSERRDDRQALRNGQIDREAFLRDRARDQRDFRRDRFDDRRDFRRDRVQDRRNFRQDQRGWNDNRGWNDRRDWNDRRRWNDGRGWGWNDGRGWNGNRGWNDGRGWSGWDRGWRQDRRYDWRGYRHANRAIYRLPRYYPPQGFGFGYQRFGIGMTLGSVLFASNYWINDPWQFRLPPIDGPFRWVRYYNDALLVDIETGEVLDVEHDVFW